MKPKHLNQKQGRALILEHKESILTAIHALNTGLDEFVANISGSALQVKPFFPVSSARVFVPEEDSEYPKSAMTGEFKTLRGERAKEEIARSYRRTHYDRDQPANTTHRCFGVAGAPIAFIEQAIEVNALKDKLKLAFSPFTSKRTTVVDPSTDQPQQVQLATAFLRHFQISDYNLLSAYRYIPFFDEQVESITYMQTEVRSVPRLTKEAALALAFQIGHEPSIEQIEALPGDVFLAAPREPYWRLRARATFVKRNSKGTRRYRMVGADLPILYPMDKANSPSPTVVEPRAPSQRRKPRSKLEPEPFLFLGAQPLYRYKT